MSRQLTDFNVISNSALTISECTRILCKENKLSLINHAQFVGVSRLQYIAGRLPGIMKEKKKKMKSSIAKITVKHRNLSKLTMCSSSHFKYRSMEMFQKVSTV